MPLALKVFRGARIRQERSPPELDVAAVESMPEPPAFLDERGRAFWDKHGPSLASIGLIGEDDLSHFALASFAWQTVSSLIEEASGPCEVMDDKGNVKVRPAFAELRRWIPMVRDLMSDYGMAGPRSRQATVMKDQLEGTVADPKKQQLDELRRQFSIGS